MNAGKTHPFGWLFIYMPFSDSLSTVLSLFHHPHSLCIVLVLFSFLFLFSPMAIYTSFSSCVSLPHPSHLSLNAHSLQLPASFLFPPELCGQLFPHCRWCDLDVGRSGGSAEAWADAGTIQQTHLYHSIPPTCMKNIVGQKPGAGRQLWHTVAFVAACINLVIYCSKLQKHKSHPTGVNSGERSACSHRPCRTPWRSAPSCCLYRSIANLFQSLVNALLIPPKTISPPQPFPLLLQLRIQRTLCCGSHNDKQMPAVRAAHNFPPQVLSGGLARRGLAGERWERRGRRTESLRAARRGGFGSAVC